MNLPDPPLIEHWLFENPWPLCLTFLLCGFILLVFRRHSLTPAVSITAAVLLTLAVCVYVLTAAVHTDREQLADLSRQLVEYVEAGDMAALEDMFDQHAILTGPKPAAEYWYDAQGLLNELKYIIDKYKVRNRMAGSIEAQFIAPQSGRTQFSVRTSLNADDSQSVNTTWHVSWRRDEHGTWRINELSWQSLNGTAPYRNLWR